MSQTRSIDSDGLVYKINTLNNWMSWQFVVAIDMQLILK